MGLGRVVVEIQLSIFILSSYFCFTVASDKHLHTSTWKPRSYLESPWSTSTSTSMPITHLSSRWQFPRGGGKLESEITDLSLPSAVTIEPHNESHSEDLEYLQQQQQQQQQHSESVSPSTGIQEDPSSFSPSQPSPKSDFFHQHPFYRRHHLTRSEEKAILGRAVLTTPHRRMPAIRIAPGPRPPFLTPQNPGPTFSSTPIYVTKSTICKSLNCELRDLRIIDQLSYNGGGGGGASRYAGPAFLARRNCIIVNVGHLRAIVMRDQVIIFVPWEQQQQNDGNQDNNGSQQKIMETINNLVEALETHLNSIYHSNHHLIVEEAPSISSSLSSSSMTTTTDGHNHNNAVYLTAKHKTSMGQQWGSGWFSQEQQHLTAISKDVHQNNTKRKKKNRLKKQIKRRGQPQYQRQIKNIPTTPTAQAPPFELVVIEALLGHVCSHESYKASKLIQIAQDLLSAITYTDNSSNKKKDAFLEMQRKLGELLRLKNKVDNLEAKCSEVASAIADVLKNDEDMAAMRLSEIAALRDLDDDSTSVNELLLEGGDPYNLHVEVELLFEDYLLQMDEVLHSLRSIQSSITNTEEVVEIELDLLRNRIMRYEMLLELSGLVVGIAAAVTGAFGMNLVNHFEDHPKMFYQVSLALVIFMGVMGYAVLRKLSMDNIL